MRMPMPILTPSVTCALAGTGKTLAFLLPALHHIVTSTTQAQRVGVTSVLVISPTRELASQIETEAKQLLTYISDVSLQCVYGGTNVKSDLSQVSSKKSLRFSGNYN